MRRAGADPDVWRQRWGVTRRGNVDDPHGHIPHGTSILHEAQPLPEDPDVLAERDRVRAALAEVRARRVPPALDEKVLVSWNALALGALAEAGAALDHPGWIDEATRTAEFLTTELVSDDGRLWHRWTPAHGAGIPAFGEDVAFLAQGLLDLFEAGHDARWLTWARRLADDADARFRDPGDGTYFTVATDGEQLIARPRELLDNAVPATSSVMTDVHLRLAALTGDLEHLDRAEQTITTLAGTVTRVPTAFGALLGAIERRLGHQTEVAVVGPPSPERDALTAVYRRTWRPSAVLAVGPPEGTDDAGAADTGTDDAAAGGAGDRTPDAPAVPLLVDRPLRDGRPTAYVCQQFVCAQPVTSPDALDAQLADVAGGARLG